MCLGFIPNNPAYFMYRKYVYVCDHWPTKAGPDLGRILYTATASGEKEISF